MAEFKFRRQKLLDFRSRQEDEKKNELGKVQSSINTQNEAIVTLKERRTKLLRKKRADEIFGSFDAQQTAMRVMMFKGIEGRISGARDKIDSMDDELARARAAYMDARRERMKIEKLKEKQQKLFKLEERRKENKRLSEMSARLYDQKEGHDA